MAYIIYIFIILITFCIGYILGKGMVTLNVVGTKKQRQELDKKQKEMDYQLAKQQEEYDAIMAKFNDGINNITTYGGLNDE